MKGAAKAGAEASENRTAAIFRFNGLSLRLEVVGLVLEQQYAWYAHGSRIAPTSAFYALDILPGLKAEACGAPKWGQVPRRSSHWRSSDITQTRPHVESSRHTLD